MSESSTDLATIVQRLEKLELHNKYLAGQNRWLKRGGYVILLLLGIVVLAAAEREKPTSGEFDKLILRDQSGKVRALMTTHKDAVGMLFYDPQGRRRVAFVTDSDGVILRLQDPDGTVRAGLSLEKSGVGMVRYMDQKQALSGQNAMQVVAPDFLKVDALSSLEDPR
jgi:hypothetical protein